MCELELKGIPFPLVIGASDRMLTAENIEFQPDMPKIWRLSPLTVAMTAGNIAVHAEILGKVLPDIAKWSTENPGSVISVEQAARLYARRYEEIRVREAESRILAPLGLETATFLDGRVEKDLAIDLMEQMQRFRDLGIHAIVCGIDTSGAHLEFVEHGRTSCKPRKLIVYLVVNECARRTANAYNSRPCVSPWEPRNPASVAPALLSRRMKTPQAQNRTGRVGVTRFSSTSCPGPRRSCLNCSAPCSPLGVRIISARNESNCRRNHASSHRYTQPELRRFPTNCG